MERTLLQRGGRQQIIGGLVLLCFLGLAPAVTHAQTPSNTTTPSTGNTTTPTQIDLGGPGSITTSPSLEEPVNPTQNVTLTPQQEASLNTSNNRAAKCDSYCKGKFDNAGILIKSILESLCCLLYGFVNAMADWATELGSTIATAIEKL